VAGSTNAYIYWAKTANSSIIDVNIMTYNEDNTIPYGTVKVYPLITDGQPSTSSINDEIKAVLTSEKIRPLTDTVVVESPSQINYAVVADIAKTKDGLASLTNSLTTIIREYASARSLELGLDVVNSKMASLCMIDGVYSAIITIVPESASLVNGNLPISNGQVSKLTGITINITDSDE
jgi:phage-related baseplate assembly protein